MPRLGALALLGLFALALHPLACDPGGPTRDKDSLPDSLDSASLQDCFTDSDADGFGDPEQVIQAVDCPSGTSLDATDCDDTSPDVHPGALEICNELDDNCDELIDNVVQEESTGAHTWYQDTDADSFGDEHSPLLACLEPKNAADNDLDCDDTDPASYPGAPDWCDDGVDQDCDGTPDQACPALCGDNLISDPAEDCDGASDSACPGLCSPLCTCPGLPPGDLQIHFIDVGHGDAIVLISPDGFVMLLDAGSALYQFALLDYLEKLALPGIDFVMASHQDEDHIGSLDMVVEDHPEVLRCFDNGMVTDRSSYEDFALACGDRLSTVELGDFGWLGPTLEIEVVHASEGVVEDDNINSIVLRLQHGTFSALLGGDCPSEGCEDELLDIEPVQLYKAHHHGYTDSNDETFLDAISPELAVITNETWDPVAFVLADLLERGIEVYQTAWDGNIVFRSDGAGTTVETSE